MNTEVMTFVTIPLAEWTAFKLSVQELVTAIGDLKQKGPGGVVVNHITAKEFMAAVKIGRTKFDALVNTSKIKVIKKKRKIYVPVSEVNRYFTDANVG
ncbi:MAG: hypothetical protein QM726_04355 [Chitinophagaceae bacterium]